MGLKDLFIKPVQEKPPEQSGDSAPVAAAPVNPLTRERLPRTAPVAADLDTAPFTEQLNDALDKADLPGQQTYLAFSKALKNMEKLPMDEATKFQAAFATLQATGSDVNQLIGSFSYFGGILDSEKDKFEEALHATIGDSVVEKENEIKKLTEENNGKSGKHRATTGRACRSQRQAQAEGEQFHGSVPHDEAAASGGRAEDQHVSCPGYRRRGILNRETQKVRRLQW
jgi:hypothetical protein